MALQIGTDSYVTVSEADGYLLSHHAPGDALCVQWTGIPNSEKENHLHRACVQINRLPFVGAKRDGMQPLAFPRRSMHDVPEAVKQAQAELALSYLDRAANKRQSFRQQGVTGYSLGDLSEHYQASSAPPLASPEALALLSGFLGGGYSIE